MLDDGPLPAWVAWILDAVPKCDHVTLELAVVTEPIKRPRGLFELYESLDHRLFRTAPDALADVDAAATLDGVPRMRVHPLAYPSHEQELAADDVAELRRRRLDVLVWLASARPRGEVLSLARFGLWSYRHGRPGRRPGTPALFWEVFREDPVFESALELCDGAGGQVIYSSIGTTDRVSLQRNRNAGYWKGARFVVRRLEDLAAGRWRPEPQPVHPLPNASSPGTAPSSGQVVRHVAAVARRVARGKLRNAALQHQWFLGVRRRNPERLPFEDPAPWRLVYPPLDRFYADPFVVRAAGETLVFIEQYVYARGRGELAVGRLGPDGRLGDVEPILSPAHHVSYPYVFGDGGRWFMIPECSEGRHVALFAATDFPRRWEPVATLLDGISAVDASVCAHDGRYWMWVNVAVPGGRLLDETFLYFSDRLEAGWAPHPRNPVVSDARRARPAGRPFVHHDRLIRPSQDCTGCYGARTVFSEVEVLTPEDYRERPLGSLGPEWAGRPNRAAHTYTFDDGWEATDGLRTLRRIGAVSRAKLRR